MTAPGLRAVFAVAAATGAPALTAQDAAAAAGGPPAAAATEAAQGATVAQGTPGAQEAQRAPATQGPALAEREWIGGLPFSQWTRLTGDWDNGRTWLEQRGVELGGGLTMDWQAVTHGGVRRRDSLVSMIDSNVALDLERLCCLPRTLFFLDAYATEGRDPSTDVGDLQGTSNIQGEDTRQVAEFWLETWFADVVRVKVGKVDFNSEFDITEEGGEFVNHAAAITPTISNAPTFPDPAGSVNVFFVPSDRCYAGVGVYDGAAADGFRTGRQGLGGFFETDESDAYLTVLEVGAAWTGGNSWGSGRLAVGAWYHSAAFQRFDGTTHRGTAGLYGVFDQRLWREDPARAGDRQGIGLMVGLGLADDDVSAIGSHVAVGLTWTGALDGRDDDVLGLLITHANLSDAPGAGFHGDETAIELLYKIQVTKALSLKPDLQYVVNPSGDPAIEDAVVLGVRLEVTF